MSSSAIFILDLKGKTIISRNYRGDVDMGVIDRFLPLLMDREEEGLACPVISNQDATFVYIKHNNIYLVSTCRSNVNVALVLSFLFKCVEVFTEYFKDVEEESVRDNFVVIYELLDEMMDFGFPQTTESRILQEFITQEGHKLEAAPRPPMAVTNAVSWRSEGIKYRKNEVFLDVIESVNMLANANGTVLQSEIVGCVKMRVYLTGMPELRLGLNDKVLFEGSGRGKSKSVELEDVKFHQCVRLSRFDNDRTISFIPPDGAFELMSYRLTTVVKPLIWIETNVERHSHSRVEFMIKAKSQFKRRSTANNVEIIIPVPSDADSPKFKTSIGAVRYAPEQSAFVWTIKSFPGGKEYLLSAHFSLPSVVGEEMEGRPPIKVKFEIPYFTTSGIQNQTSMVTAPLLATILKEFPMAEVLPFLLYPLNVFLLIRIPFQMRHYTVITSAPTLFRRLCSSKPATTTPVMLFTPRRITGFTFQCFSNSSTVTEHSPSSSHDDLIPGPGMLKRIVEDLEASGRKFILPTGDSDAMQTLSLPLKSLAGVGVKPEFLIDACVKNPDLFRNLTTKGEDAWQILNMLVESCAMTYEDALRMFATLVLFHSN
ncbi:adaptor complexe medium subunit family protein [Ancylostoma caninum]|uniref:Adaptor complexe medium subunit family protein n=1 Tax=Ancylostoma caninum TaxID=29170 RepID=A0A368H154_ANCCA|nr:adaptor complexe medium subunit family protein [Ancylostoma caninum]